MCREAPQKLFPNPHLIRICHGLFSQALQTLRTKVTCLWSMVLSVLEASPSSGDSLEWGENVGRKEKGWVHGTKGALYVQGSKNQSPT